MHRIKFLFHPAHSVAYILDPRYARSCTIPRTSAIRTLYKFMHRDSHEDPLQELASFYESFTFGQHSQMWDSDLIALPPDRWWILAEDA
jgi:hypothetical protein